MSKDIHLKDGDIELRLLQLKDRNDWVVTRAINQEWLKPWAPTSPVPEAALTYPQMVKFHKRESKAGRSHNFGIWFRKEFVGEITLSGIYYGSYRGANIGYWISQTHANMGITTKAVLEVTRFALEDLGLHRVEISLCPENEPSKRVAIKAGYVLEGLRPRYLHINGEWRDHITFVKECPSKGCFKAIRDTFSPGG